INTRNLISTALGALVFGCVVTAQPALPSAFKSRTVTSPDGASIFVRSAGSGPVVVLLHGYAETSNSWAPLATELIKSYTVVVPDVRGIGKSSHPPGGYDKKTQASDIRAVVTTLGLDRASVVSHDIGIMVAYAYAARYPDKVERLVAGRERVYLDRIWNAFSADPKKPDEATRAFYAAQYAQPGAMRAGFAQFAAFPKDVEDNTIFQRTKLKMPVLAVGGAKSFGTTEAVVMRNVATNVREAVVPNAGHWLMEENTAFTVKLIQDFLKDQLPPAPPQSASAAEKRVTPSEFKFPSNVPGTGTSGVSGIQTVVLKGDPDKAGLYTIMLRIPAHTQIAAHVHQDDRVATVVSGTWYMGYGDSFNAASLKA